jgi:alpha-beta hydrolase superfamily lysophospholipase
VETDTFEFRASDGHGVFCYRWLPAGTPRAVIHIAHGMGEHAGRYRWTAGKLVEAGYAVVADDHRGHGKTAIEPGQFGEDGWNRILADTRELIEAAARQYPGAPRVLLGHSMGAMLAQQYIASHGNTIDGVILSGSPGFAHPLESRMLQSIVRFERWRVGDTGSSSLLDSLIFGSANRPFERDGETVTGFEWLSRDTEQVKAYVDDPLCGFVPCCGSLFDLFAGARWTQRRHSIRRIPAGLPMLVFSGTDDPVHNRMKNIHRLLSAYRHRGLDPETRFYESGRHEMLNEQNREQVIADVIAWLAKHCSQT